MLFRDLQSTSFRGADIKNQCKVILHNLKILTAQRKLEKGAQIHGFVQQPGVCYQAIFNQNDPPCNIMMDFSRDRYFSAEIMFTSTEGRII